jgi:hypothetical protein
MAPHWQYIMRCHLLICHVASSTHNSIQIVRHFVAHLYFNALYRPSTHIVYRTQLSLISPYFPNVNKYTCVIAIVFINAETFIVMLYTYRWRSVNVCVCISVCGRLQYAIIRHMLTNCSLNSQFKYCLLFALPLTFSTLWKFSYGYNTQNTDTCVCRTILAWC